MKTIASFDVQYDQFLDSEGEPQQALPEFARDPATLISLYCAMVLARGFDTKAIALQRTGKLGTFASALGQEAIGVGTATAMRAEDVLLPSYREHAAQFCRGVSMRESLLYWGGDERGSDYAEARQDFPNCVTIAAQVCHAAGVAYAKKLRHEAGVAVCIFGDGGTSKGDFYEGMNLAGVCRLPLVMVVNNNQWAISLPRSLQSAARTLAQKAIAAGIEGFQVDGNDVIAVREAVGRGLDRARAGDGPTLIEALSYRLGDHTTADDATRYRDPETVNRQWQFEPVARLRKYLARIGAWDKEKEEALLRECSECVNQAVEAYLATPPQSGTAMFDHLYAELPAGLQAQREEAFRFAPRDGENHGGS
ncbi:MAG: pyruvate dehydrogenase (acetyl-transferring) E1 component subunit alpha [Sterolibacterium sp.]